VTPARRAQRNRDTTSQCEGVHILAGVFQGGRRSQLVGVTIELVLLELVSMFSEHGRTGRRSVHTRMNDRLEHHAFTLMAPLPY
jgi:hypothetical protein